MMYFHVSSQFNFSLENMNTTIVESIASYFGTVDNYAESGDAYFISDNNDPYGNEIRASFRIEFSRGKGFMFNWFDYPLHNRHAKQGWFSLYYDYATMTQVISQKSLIDRYSQWSKPERFYAPMFFHPWHCIVISITMPLLNITFSENSQIGNVLSNVDCAEYTPEVASPVLHAATRGSEVMHIHSRNNALHMYYDLYYYARPISLKSASIHFWHREAIFRINYRSDVLSFNGRRFSVINSRHIKLFRSTFPGTEFVATSQIWA